MALELERDCPTFGSHHFRHCDGVVGLDRHHTACAHAARYNRKPKIPVSDDTSPLAPLPGEYPRGDGRNPSRAPVSHAGVRRFPSTVLEMAELGALFEAHWPRLTAIVRRRLDPSLGVRLDPEDVVNAAFLDAPRGWANDPPL